MNMADEKAVETSNSAFPWNLDKIRKDKANWDFAINRPMHIFVQG